MRHVNRNIRSELHRVRVEHDWPSADADLYTSLGVSKDELSVFQQELRGEVITPASPGYDRDRKGSGSSPFESRPMLIVYCNVFNDVAVCLAWARRHGWWITTRSGGHSTAGYSVNSGLVIDVSRLDSVTVDVGAQVAKVGPGIQFYDLNTQLATYGLHIPGGGCGNVAVGGFMQGGGYGFTSRKFGINCDNVLALTVMLADGTVVVADPNVNDDLFWAVRGGTGNQFGIVLEITYRLHRLDECFGFTVAWELADAPHAMAAMQRAYTFSQDTVDVGFMGGICQLGDAPRTVFTMFGVYPGSEQGWREAFQPMLDVGSPTVGSPTTGTYAELDEHLIDNYLPGVPPGETFELKDSGYIVEEMSADEWAELLDYHDEHTPNHYNILFVEPYGGVINTVPEGFNAFIHRNAYMDLYVDSFWQRGTDFTDEAAARTFLDGYFEIIDRHTAGEKYQNYPQRRFDDWRWAFFADAYNSLLFVKRKYDPDGVFHFEQSIGPYPDDPGIRRSTAPSRFSDPAITEQPWSRLLRDEPHGA